jgi:Fe-S oxidoreductase
MTDYSKLEPRRNFIERCARCSQCKFVPVPKSQAHASICPSMDFGEFHAFSGGGQLIMGAALLSGDATVTPGFIEALSSCSMCGGCDISCKVNFGESIEPLDNLYALREQIVAAGHSPSAHEALIQNIRNFGNSAGAGRTERTKWQEGLKHIPSPAPGADVLLHIGSTLSLAKGKHESLRAVVGALQDAGIGCAYLGEEEGSCGSLAFDLGYADDARRLASKFAEQVAELRVSTVVTFSSAAIATFRAIYPRLGISFGTTRVVHITEYLAELLDRRAITMVPSPTVSGSVVAYHDSCKLGRLSEAWVPHDIAVDTSPGGFKVSRAPDLVRFGNNGIYEAPRRLVCEMGAQLAELERNRASSYCCGANGGVRESVPEAAAKAAQARLAEVPATGARLMVSACVNCTDHLERHAEGVVQTVDLLELVAASIRAGAN